MPEVTKIELELLKDIDIHVFTYWKGMRGGIFYISKRYSEANNK